MLSKTLTLGLILVFLFFPVSIFAQELVEIVDFPKEIKVGEYRGRAEAEAAFERAKKLYSESK